ATEAGARFLARGGSGSGALFAFAPGAITGGATLGVGGSLVAGPRAASFDVVATDLPCNAQVMARVEVVGPFTVTPSEVTVATRGTVRFAAAGNLGTVQWELLASPPDGDATLGADGAFVAGTTTGTYLLRGRDAGSGREVQSVVRVGAGTAFGPEVAILALPAGRRAPLRWRGGSGAVDATLVGDARGVVLARAGADWVVDATRATPGMVSVQGVNRATNERAVARISVGEELAPTPIARGPQNLFGDVVFGDLNGDGRADLIVGQANRSRTGLETGGVLVYYADGEGRWADTPDLELDGARDLDHFGALLLADDADGDGITDLVVCSQDQDLGRDGRGAVTVYLGSRAGLTRTPERVLVGDAANDRFGAAALLTDLDGDGAKDLVVSAPNATNSFAQGACRLNGRVYIYRGARGLRGIFDAVPAQVIEVRDRLTDTDGAPDCRAAIDAGRSLALVDMDRDGRDDLAVGAPLAAYGPMGAPVSNGAVLLYRGLGRGAFEPTAAWSVHLASLNRPANPRFGTGLDVVPFGSQRALVVRTPFFGQNVSGVATAQTGAFWVFPEGGLGPPGQGGMTRVVLSANASTRWTGALNDGAARSAALADFDGDGELDYLVGGAGDSAPNGALYRFHLIALAGSAIPTPASTVRGEAGEFLGARVAALPRARGAAGLAVWSAYRNTQNAYAGSAVWLVDPAPSTEWTTHWSSRRELALPVFAAGDRTGTGLAIGPMRGGGSGDVALGSTGTHSPPIPTMGATAARVAGFRARVGVVDVLASDGNVNNTRLWQDRSVQLGAAVAVLDFNGDGLADVAVGDPTANSGGSDWVTQRLVANDAADPCFLRVGATVPTASVAGRGVVRVYLSRADGPPLERCWLIPRETVPTGGTARRLGFGAVVANAGDVNGDGVEDLLVGRAGGATTNGAEVVLGRAADAMGRVLAHCGDPATAPWWEARADNTVSGVAVSRLGDLDGDGCAEVAVSVSGNTNNSPRAGVSVQYGFGPRCGARTTAEQLLLVADGRALRDNVPGDEATRANDLNDLPGVSTGMGLVLAGGVDLTGDRVPDLVYRDAALSFRETTGPAVEVISGAFLAGLCPAGRCADGRRDSFVVDGAYRALGVRELTAPQRMIVPAPSMTTARFGSCLATADIDSDGIGDLLVGAQDYPEDTVFAGAVFGWRGGITQDTLVGAPWLRAVGDLEEVGTFGQTCAARAVRNADGGGAWLAVGAPASNHRGALTGAAYRWRIR
ncbi:MAG: FG-GAP-like repeat-containing protein, partial [Polyangiales bacterium]